jgi:transposase
MSIEVTKCMRTLRLKVKTEAYRWLNAAAAEVNQVWNYANATSDKAARPFSGPASSGCGDTHDRDVNAARNILSAGRCSPSMSGNERSSSLAPTSQAYRRCESGKSALKKAA